jgi:hypothetical protein
MLAACSAGAPAVTQSGGPMKCTVTTGEKFLATAGGEQALCAAVERALAGSSAAEVAVTVAPRSQFAADVTMRDGRKLSTVHYMEADRPLDRSSIDRLAAAIAGHVSTNKAAN